MLKSKEKVQDYPHPQAKNLNQSNEDKKAVSPPTQQYMIHINSAQDLNNYQK